MRSNFIKFIIVITFALFFSFTCLPRSANADVPDKVKVGIVTANKGSQYRNATSVSFKVKGNYQVIDMATFPGSTVIGKPSEGEDWQIFYLAGGVQAIQNGQALKVTTGPIVVKELSHQEGNLIYLQSFVANGSSTNIGRWYRGDMEFRNNGSSLLAINELPLEEYLYGVVPREMSNKWPAEALKAQAVAARTYVVANYSKHVVEGFNVLDTPSDQVYGGFNSEGDNATKAVDDTAGQIITYNGSPISAVYHSTSGGHTENNENVWGGKAYDYLRGKTDPYSTKDGLANWTYTTNFDDIRVKLVNSGVDIGKIDSINLEKYDSGRVKNVIIRDVNGNTIKKSGSEFGKMFNPGFYTYNSTTSFMSNFFDIRTNNSSTQSLSVLNGSGKVTTVSGDTLYGVSDDGTTEKLAAGADKLYVLDSVQSNLIQKASASGSVVIEGHGWGHGVGMSQWGAYRMALEGKSYRDIINFYYNGVEIED